MSYLRETPGTRRTPQKEQIPGRTDQVANSEGGYVWKTDALTRLTRWLILGSEGGSYYASEQKLTKENVRCLSEADPFEAVKLIVEISDSGRAPKNDPAIYGLAFYSGYGGKNPNARQIEVRRAALNALPQVCRTGTHLLHFLEFVEKFRGHGPALNKAIARWFTREDVDGLAYQLVKYRSRDAWAQRDAIRLARPKPPTRTHDALFRWLIEQQAEVKGDRSEAYQVRPGELPRIVEGYVKAQAARTPKETARLVGEYNLPREALNTDHLTSPEVWEALLYAGRKTIDWVAPEVVERYGGMENVPDDAPRIQKEVGGMPLGALIRNLPTLTRVGIIGPMSFHNAEITRRITDPAALKAARVHPIQVLSAHLTYQQGHSVRGNATWSPESPIVDALDAAFYAAFGAVEPTGKRMLLALDVSSSMDGFYGGVGSINGVPGLTPRIASAAMALVTAAVEPNHYFLAFSHELVPMEISPRERLDAVVRKLSAIGFGGTDCALPMLWAAGAKFQPVGGPGYHNGRYGQQVQVVEGDKTVPVDAFVVYTDSETHSNAGIHPAQALVHYREKTGIAARSVVVGLVSNGFSIADPQDPGQLDVVGFDSAAPQIISDFIRGAI